MVGTRPAPPPRGRLSGNRTSPLPAAITLDGAAAGDTVSQSQVSVQSASGNNLLFISGSDDIVNLSGGADTITDTGQGNTYILPAAANGTDTFTSDITASGGTLDLTAALAATNWNGSAATLSDYVTVTHWRPERRCRSRQPPAGPPWVSRQSTGRRPPHCQACCRI